MNYREGSPAASENELDISGYLFARGQASDSSESEDVPASPNKLHSAYKNQGISLELEDGESSGDEGFIAAHQVAANRKSLTLKGKTVKKGGGFQAMGLNAILLKAITRKGFSVPTPIQRKAVPFILDSKDVVGMARTGSGKTAAFVIPMIEKLKSHSAKVGSRAVILSPSRELALQTLKVVKELGRGTDLRTILLVGGDNLEEQFGSLTTNPDIIIATPGRFLHLKVEMGLDLSSIRYVVFDEADRLFEMGFAAQLGEILHALPSSRQTLLFSATLPKSLVEFARAGLQEPKLIRLDADSKISPDLESAFFTIKSSEKDGALLYILERLIKIPNEGPEIKRNERDETQFGKKRKRNHSLTNAKDSPTPYSTIIFAATKHHVEYLGALLKALGYAASYIYGSLDQTARKEQVQDFRSGSTNILVVTDVAARGIDIPILANVINYHFPSQPKVFVHRVGRTARAGRNGWSYNLITETDVPYLLDLQLFLSRKLIAGRRNDISYNFATDVVVGGLMRDHLEESCETITKLSRQDENIGTLHSVAAKGEKLYLRTRNSASSESAKRSKHFISSQSYSEPNMLFTTVFSAAETERDRMLARVSGFRPAETIFEIGKRGSGAEAAEIMRKRRGTMRPTREKSSGKFEVETQQEDGTIGETYALESALPMKLDHDNSKELESDNELEITVSHPTSRVTSKKDPWEDVDHFMTYAPKLLNLTEDTAYGVHSGSYGNPNSTAFLEAARGVTMDLNQDESKSFSEANRARGLRWDKKGKKYVQKANDEDGSRGAKLIVGESGHKIAATYRSGRYEAWRKANKIGKLPRTGETERISRDQLNRASRHYRHRKEKAPKTPDKFRDDYHKRKKQLNETKEKLMSSAREGKTKNELRGVDDVRKQRTLKVNRREKNARPSQRRKT